MGTISGDLHINGDFSASSMTIPSGSVSNVNVISGDDIDVDKMDEAVHHHGTNFGKAIGEAPPATQEELIGAVTRAGSIRGFHALLDVTGSASSVTKFTLGVDGNYSTTAIATRIMINNVIPNGTVESATIVTAGISAGSKLSIRTCSTALNGNLGAYAWVEYEENLLD